MKKLPVLFFILTISALFSCKKQTQAEMAEGSYYGPYIYGTTVHEPGVTYVTRVNDNMVNIKVDFPGLMNYVPFDSVLIQDLVTAPHSVTTISQGDTLRGSFGSEQFVWYCHHHDTLLTFSGKK